jgi:hypothetical protein
MPIITHCSAAMTAVCRGVAARGDEIGAPIADAEKNT